jgi:site-specific recombinase XerD
MKTNKILDEELDFFLKYLPMKHALIFKLGISTGLRISDIVSLKKNLLFIEKPTIIEKKTKKSKRIYIKKQLREELLWYAETFSQNEYIFYSPNSKKGHISRQAVHKMFKKWSKTLKLSGNIAPHSMRKNYASKFLSKGKSFKYIQGKLNHENTTETLIYLLDELMKRGI